MNWWSSVSHKRNVTVWLKLGGKIFFILKGTTDSGPVTVMWAELRWIEHRKDGLNTVKMWPSSKPKATYYCCLNYVSFVSFVKLFRISCLRSMYLLSFGGFFLVGCDHCVDSCYIGFLYGGYEILCTIFHIFVYVIFSIKNIIGKSIQENRFRKKVPIIQTNNYLFTKFICLRCTVWRIFQSNYGTKFKGNFQCNEVIMLLYFGGFFVVNLTVHT